ncbi:MAG: MCE family protein [Solirubrobacteraceae bacterium]|nr:MCE family protein [Solirubrobacteraceae bacterium]
MPTPISSRRGRSTSTHLPLGRTSLVIAIAAALGFVGYSLAQDGVRPPWAAEPFELTATMVNAAGLSPDNEPLVYVAGVPMGRVTAVRYADRRAHVTMTLEPAAKGRVFRDATLRLRPQNAANVLAAVIAPGTPASGALASGAQVKTTRRSTPVTPDDAYSTFDADTRTALTVLLSEARRGLDGRGGDLAQTLRGLDATVDPATRVTDLLLKRREVTARLVTEIDTIFTTIATRRRELRTSFAATHEILQVTAEQRRALSAALRTAPDTLDELERTLDEFERTEPALTEALERTEPLAKQLGPTLRAVQETAPNMRALLRAVGGLARAGETTLPDVQKSMEGLAVNQGALYEHLAIVERMVGGMNENKATLTGSGIAAAGAFSQQDNRSTLVQGLVLGIATPKPENFGLPATPAGRRTLRSLLPKAMDLTCGDPKLECGDRFMKMATAVEGRQKDGQP